MGNTKTPSSPSFPTMTSSNPYATATINALGTSYKLNPFLTAQNQTIESTVPQLYQRLARPTLDDAVSLARRQAFAKVFNEDAKTSFENNLVNPLSQRRMLRSSLLNDMTNNLQKNQTSHLANFNNNLLANSIADTQSLANFYMNQYANNAAFGQNTLNSVLSAANPILSYNMNAQNLLNSGGASTVDWAQMAGTVLQLLSYIK